MADDLERTTVCASCGRPTTGAPGKDCDAPEDHPAPELEAPTEQPHAHDSAPITMAELLQALTTAHQGIGVLQEQVRQLHAELERTRALVPPPPHGAS